ncbi:hypothetical protein BH09BAC5_BH09BAC5_12880 [soil metagenome]
MKNVITRGEMANIFLKDGNQKTGLLLNEVNREDAFDKGVIFSPHNNVGAWLESFSKDFILILQPETVDLIDLYAK